MTTTLAAYRVLRAILDAASGEPFLPSVIAALFLLGAQATLTLLSNWNSGTQYATVDVLNSAWNYLAGTIMPIAAGLAIVGAVFNLIAQRPMMHLVAVTLALLSVSGIWYLAAYFIWNPKIHHQSPDFEWRRRMKGNNGGSKSLSATKCIERARREREDHANPGVHVCS
jgi:hypothetical protein